MKLMPSSSTALSSWPASSSLIEGPFGGPRSSIAPNPRAVTSRPVPPSVRVDVLDMWSSCHVVAELLVPVGVAPFGDEVEQVPHWLDGPDVTRILSGVRCFIEELRAPEVADDVAVAVEHIQHRHLLTVWCLAVVLAVIGVHCRGPQWQPSPPTILPTAAYASRSSI